MSCSVRIVPALTKKYVMVFIMAVTDGNDDEPPALPMKTTSVNLADIQSAASPAVDGAQSATSPAKPKPTVPQRGASKKTPRMAATPPDAVAMKQVAGRSGTPPVPEQKAKRVPPPSCSTTVLRDFATVFSRQAGCGNRSCCGVTQ